MTSRVVEVAAARLDGWLERFAANNPDGPQRVAGVERFDHDPLAVVLVRRGGYAVGVATGERTADFTLIAIFAELDSYFLVRGTLEVDAAGDTATATASQTHVASDGTVLM